MNYANLITLSRIFLSPFIVINLVKNNWYISIILFSISVFTDLFDGAIARHFNQETIIGSYLDPLADKILVVSCYLTLSLIKNDIFSVPLWFVGITLAKELLLVVGSIYLNIKNNFNLKIEPIYSAKILMVLQAFFIFILFIALSNKITTLNNVIKILIYIISMLNIWVLIQYYLKFKTLIKL